jgi:hypothetical protein
MIDLKVEKVEIDGIGIMFEKNELNDDLLF